MINYECSLKMHVPSMYPYVDILTMLFGDLSSLAQKINDVNARINESDETSSLSEKFGFGINLAADEAIKNAMQHGNKGDVEKEVTVTYTLTTTQLIIKVEDQGSGFTPPTKLNVDVSPDSESGRGLLLIQNFMDEVHFNEAGNVITMIKDISGERAIALP